MDDGQEAQVLKGDLARTGLPEVLSELAGGAATGCLRVVDPVGEEAKVYLRGGSVYAVLVPGRRSQLGSRLVSSGTLAPEALADALEAQRTELQGWRLGELLVHLGYVDQAIVEAFVHEQVLAALGDLVGWTAGTWRFRPNEKTREDVAPPVDVPTLLAAVAHRTAAWQEIVAVVDGPEAVPVLSASGGGSSETTVGADAWSLLCKVDGLRTVAELARDCGFTLYEAGQTLYELVTAGLVEVESASVDDAPPADVEPEPFLPASLASRLTAAFAPAAEPVAPVAEAPVDVAALISSALREPSADPLDQVSAALSALLGPAPTAEDAFTVPARKQAVLTPEQQAAAAAREEKAARDRARRRRDADELAAAQAELEADRLAAQQAAEAALGDDHVAPVVDLGQARREAARVEAEKAAAEEAAEAARVEAERIAAEAAEAVAAEAARVEAERVAAEAVAVEAARVEAERIAAEAAEAVAAEAARVEAERIAAEAAEAAAAEAARVEAERIAAETAAAEAARVEAERIAAEQAAAEQAAAEQAAAEAAAAEALRLAIEEESRREAERLAQEQQAAAEAARLAAEQQAEAQRAAEEQARREQQAAAEAARLAAEEQARREQQAAAEAARLAAEQQAEAERVAAEQAAEAARLAAEQQAEAERVAAEQHAEAQRRAAEQAEAQQLAEEQSRAQAEQEAAAAAEAQRLADEQALLLRAELTAFEEEAPAAPQLDPADAAAAFAELRATADTATEAQPEPEPEPVAAFEEPAWEPAYAPQETDTAALLRELSSLGLDDDAPPPPPVRPPSQAPTRPAPVAAGAGKKRKGLFSRG